MWNKIIESFKTWIAFMIALNLLPVFIISYTVLNLGKKLWMKLLSSRYPHLEFIEKETLSVLLDTHRNQAIINVLLCVQGPPDVNELKQYLIYNLIEKRDKYGRKMFPRMSTALVSCWGNYAWDKTIPYNIENNFIIANGVYRGRTVTDTNIQDYVSDIVSKYFPAFISPWQYIVISTSNNDKHFILLRIHHVLLNDKYPIQIGDIISTNINGDNIITKLNTKTSPLDNMIFKFNALSELYSKIEDTCTNIWNEFIAEYDPIESPHAFKTMPGLFHCVALCVIIIITTVSEAKKRIKSRNYITKYKLYITLLKYQCHRRQLTIFKIVVSPFITFNPMKYPELVYKFIAYMMQCVFTLPKQVYVEILAFKSFTATGKLLYPESITWKWSSVIKLFWLVILEIYEALSLVYWTPRQLYTDMFSRRLNTEHALQSTSITGRKVCSWSNPIKYTTILKLCNKYNVSTSDVFLYAAVQVMCEYLKENKHNVPQYIPMTVRTRSAHLTLYAKTNCDDSFNSSPSHQYKGMTTVCLPVNKTPTHIRNILQCTLPNKRLLSYIKTESLMKAIPSLFTQIMLNMMTRRYTITYTHLTDNTDSSKRVLHNDNEVLYIVYWRPTQANVSFSLTVLEYSDNIILGVMCDSHLSQGRVIPSTKWSQVLESLLDPEPCASSKRNTSSAFTTTRSESYLKPPDHEINSPPPVKRTISQRF